MNTRIATVFLVFLGIGICRSQDWSKLKEGISPKIELPLEYDTIYRQPLSGLGWEDGLHISKDGLHLYCTYVPIDFLSFGLNGNLPNNFSTKYSRGAPDFGMDIVSNPILASEWLHSDILFASKSNIDDSFTSWQLSNLARPFYSEGAPSLSYFSGTSSKDIMLFTSNDNTTNNLDIRYIQNKGLNPSGIGTVLPTPVTTNYNEDNPHLIGLQDGTMILFYDSNNLPGGKGDIDIWYSKSNDFGGSWNSPVNVSSVNTASKEHQPFIYYDKKKEKYFLYYSAYHIDNKLAIFRKEQLVANDWDSWGNTELVVSAGNSAGIGEPSLTESGDISFVVVYEDPELNSIYNRFDSDPWYARKKNPLLRLDDFSTKEKDVIIYPNPSSGIINIEPNVDIENATVFDSQGKMILQSRLNSLDLSRLNSGVYSLKLKTISGVHFEKLLINK